MDKDTRSPEFVSIETMLKARPSEEKGERFIWLEASREAADQQNDVVLAKALEDSADHFLSYGVIDLEHKSIPSVAASFGIENPAEWEVGIPDEVVVKDGVTMVKARLFQGETPLAAKANMVWDSMTKLHPASRWYASVGGSTLAKSQGIDRATKGKVNFISKVRWGSLALTRQPCNQHVSAVQTVPFGLLAKCWTPEGIDLHKALEASYATDVASLEGGGAFGRQSLDTGGEQPKSYFNFRDMLSNPVLKGELSLIRDDLMQFAAKFNLAPETAADWVDRFLGDLNKSLPNGVTNEPIQRIARTAESS